MLRATCAAQGFAANRLEQSSPTVLSILSDVGGSLKLKLKMETCFAACSERKPKVRVTISDNAFTLGWWMVMSEDEQGYAPASYLEPVEGNSTEKDVHMEEITDQGRCMVGWSQAVTG